MFERRTVEEVLQLNSLLYNEKEKLVYHNTDTGRLHDICSTARYASYIFSLKFKEYYGIAKEMILRVLSFQDTDEDSPTYGTWPNFLERPLDTIPFVDYNIADFIAKTFIDILYLNPEVLDQDLLQKIETALRNALECIIRRNVAPDYTNISIISCMNLICAGEKLQDKRIFEIGKKRLQNLLEYTRFNTGLSEYNSSNYAVLNIEDTSRMMEYFQDEECRKLAEEINFYAWDMLTSHFNIKIGQLSPPQTRSYIDLEHGKLETLIYLASDGKYGKLENVRRIEKPWLLLKFHCPDECLKKLDFDGEKWIDHTYYRRNNIISQDQETAIITNRNNPDMSARSYMTDNYSMGSFSACDLWGQRRTCMIVADRDEPWYLRLRGLKDGRDFCSAIVYAAQHKNVILGHIGFVTDRGVNHYVADLDKSGIYETEALCFRFELGGATDSVSVMRQENSFIFKSKSHTVTLNISQWIYDGKQAEINFDRENKYVDLVCFKEKKQMLDLNKLQKTYGTFTLSVDVETQLPTYIENEDGSVSSMLRTSEGMLRVKSKYLPVGYDEALKENISLFEEGGLL